MDYSDSYSLEEKFWNSLSIAVDHPSPRSIDSFDEEDPQRRPNPSMSPSRRKLRKKWGSRKNQRYMNDTFLGRDRDRDEDEDEEPDQLFEWKSNFESIVHPHSRQSAAWAPFVEIKEDHQRILLHKINPQNVKRRAPVRIDKHTKRLLQKSQDSPIVQRLELSLSLFCEGKDQPEEDPSFGFSHKSTENYLFIRFEDDPTGFQRLLGHAVAQFFNLNSKSESDQNRQKILVIQRTTKSNVPKFSLKDYLSLSVQEISIQKV